MTEIVPFAETHLSGVVDVILPIQQAEFHIPISLGAQPDPLDIPGLYQTKHVFEIIDQNDLPESFSIMSVDTKFYRFTVDHKAGNRSI